MDRDEVERIDLTSVDVKSSAKKSSKYKPILTPDEVAKAKAQDIG